MKSKSNALLVSLLLGAAAVVPAAALAAQDAPERDPVRWSTEDTTPQARYRTATKEAGAALREALADCRRSGGRENAACAREARQRFAQDMADAKQLLAR